MGLAMALREVSPSSREQWWKLLSEFVPLQADVGSFDCATASHSRSSRFAQDDRVEVDSSKRSSTSSTLLEPVAWNCFRILAFNDASRISMVIVGSLALRVKSGVNRIARGMGPWNPISRKRSEKWGTRQRLVNPGRSS
jgi:hypothetical protein